jgi:TolA-binding protein
MASGRLTQSGGSGSPRQGQHRRQGARHDKEQHNEEEMDRLRETEQQIQELKTEIQQKQIVEKEQQCVKESHGLRFLKQQRLTQAEHSTCKLLSSSSTPEEREGYETELQRIALDQVYMAHITHDMKCLPLFQDGIQIVDAKEKLLRHAMIQEYILKSLEARVKWIPPDQYNQLPKEWSVELETKTFAAPAKGDTTETKINNS